MSAHVRTGAKLGCGSLALEVQSLGSMPCTLKRKTENQNSPHHMYILCGCFYLYKKENYGLILLTDTIPLVKYQHINKSREHTHKKNPHEFYTMTKLDLNHSI